ncbi:MAG: helix-turn-helix domain-containing protein [Ignavibacteriales bacterium]|nr:helix-turn-helix domain-containing protein [Ignavibacteriales bacterium]
MRDKRYVTESKLSKLAKRYRIRSGKNKTQAAKELNVSRPTIHHAEEDPSQSLSKLRRKIIERYSPFKVVGPVFVLRRKTSASK